MSRTAFFVNLLFILVTSVFSGTVLAAKGIDDNKFAAILVDNNTGEIIFERNSAEKRYPASLVKMMTAYVTFDAIKSGEATFNKQVLVSQNAARQNPTVIGIKPGEMVEIRDLLLATIIKSANDAAVALAEGVGGTEWQFVNRMNKIARRLGMEDTEFGNPNGLHDQYQHTTARDLAKLAIALRRDFPEYYHFFSIDQFFFRGRPVYSHNHLTRYYDGVDGIKTGYTVKSGYNVASSVRLGKINLVAVIMGARSRQARDVFMKSLLEYGLRFMAIQSKPSKGSRFGSNKVTINSSANKDLSSIGSDLSPGVAVGKNFGTAITSGLMQAYKASSISKHIGRSIASELQAKTSMIYDIAVVQAIPLPTRKPPEIESLASFTSAEASKLAFK